MTSEKAKYLGAFLIYWNGYGGWLQILWSPYFLLATVLFAALHPVWALNYSGEDSWVFIPLGIIPSMVSFSLGAVAIFLSFSNKDFLSLIRQKGNEKSYLMKVVTAFFHFILVQFFALFSCFFLIAYPNFVVSALTFWIFMYSLCCGLAAAAALLDTADILNKLGGLDD